VPVARESPVGRGEDLSPAATDLRAGLEANPQPSAMLMGQADHVINAGDLGEPPLDRLQRPREALGICAGGLLQLDLEVARIPLAHRVPSLEPRAEGHQERHRRGKGQDGHHQRVPDPPLHPPHDG